MSIRDKKREASEKRPDVRERLCKALDILPDMIPGCGMVEIRGRNLVSINEGGKILFYSPERISVKLKKGSVSVCGQRLACISYYPDSVGIEGYICSVTFEED